MVQHSIVGARRGADREEPRYVDRSDGAIGVVETERAFMTRIYFAVEFTGNEVLSTAA